MNHRRRALAPILTALLIAAASRLTAAAPVTLATLKYPGTPAFVRVARDVTGVVFAMDPSVASDAGLFDDADRVPSYRADTVHLLLARLDADLAAMRAMPWRSWSVDGQIDFRWIYANAELARRELAVEKIFTHRPGAWLEPTANNFIALLTYAPARLDLQASVTAKIPAMVAEMRRTCTALTRRDVATARGLIDGLLVMLRAPLPASPAAAKLQAARGPAVTALTAYRKEILAAKNLPEVKMIGAENYAWRLRHAMLLPWTPQQLLALAQRKLTRVNARIARLARRVPPGPPKPTPVQRKLARGLTKAKLLALYDAVEASNRRATVRAGFVTIPPGVGPIHARETPDAMVPLTGDGGSMDPPPAEGSSNVGWWNVEHFHAKWTLAQRVAKVVGAQDYRRTGLGPYAAHEGFPGHHLQLSIARLSGNPIRSILSDSTENEGWALYVEDEFWRKGGLGKSPDAAFQTLDSYRFRIKRVVYDVNLETGAWTLQQGADFKDGAKPGHGKVDEDVLRTVSWPTQLICYFAGKQQILALKAAYQKKMGKRYRSRDFHDRLLALGSIPFVFARAKLLGEPVPGL